MVLVSRWHSEYQTGSATGMVCSLKDLRRHGASFHREPEGFRTALHGIQDVCVAQVMKEHISANESFQRNDDRTMTVESLYWIARQGSLALSTRYAKSQIATTGSER